MELLVLVITCEEIHNIAVACIERSRTAENGFAA
jgi:hypothetical protein